MIRLDNVRSVPRDRATRRWRFPRAIATLAHLVLAFAVVFGIAHSGSRYFYCEALGLLPSDPCAGASSDAHGQGPSGTLSETPRSVWLPP